MDRTDHMTRAQVLAAAICASVLSLSLAALLPPPGRTADKNSPPTFTKDVAPILFKSCVKCHQTGELASDTPLTSYAAARSRATQIKDKVVSREMPPWPADPAKSLKFRNDPRLSQQEIDTIVGWVDAGAPEGNKADLPALPNFEDGWTHPQGRKPDLVISLPGEVRLPAEGAIPYVRMLAKVPFTEDHWITASQTRPTTPWVVHHMALTEVALPEGMAPAAEEELSRKAGFPNGLFDTPAVMAPSNPPHPDMLAIYTPGSTFEMYGPNGAKLLKGGKNMYLIFNIHYETVGHPQTDRSRIALWFAPEPPARQIFRVNGAGESLLANGKELLTDVPGIKAEGTNVVIPPIPPFAADYELTGVTGYLQPVTVYQLQPHAHHRGKAFTYLVVYPDGSEQTLLTISKYDHRWQMAYELETPLTLPAGSKLIVTGHYDNSKEQMHNPAPEKPVYFRDMNQGLDEMFTPFVQYGLERISSGPDGKASAQNWEAAGPGVWGIGQVVGCVEKSSGGSWVLTNGSAPARSDTQATTSAAVQAAQAIPLGSVRYELLGTSVFNPSAHLGEKVVVKGIVIKTEGDARINVTSFQTLASSCAASAR